ncbi:MAG: NAD(P)/FAD-dependent oxidoreductase [Marinilabiliaceae bacterium]|nr:NAD(P)/FAD-dependent oxidoreductase [Marinilabiliaceae bacterium]
MNKEIIIRISPEDSCNENKIKSLLSESLNISTDDISDFRIKRSSIDARKNPVLIQLQIEVSVGKEKLAPKVIIQLNYSNVTNSPEVIIVGAGPCGLFAALRLIELGLKPIVIERGKDVHERKKDLALLNKNNPINSESNYAFGEGGAGAFSDGKLNTRSKKRGNVNRILHIFCFHGADEKITIEAQPHIGSDKLPIVIENIRKTITDCGGEIRFNTKMEDLIVKKDKIEGIITQKGEIIRSKAVILATGHSAQDVYKLLHHKGITIEAKPFAMGVRVEHPQKLIDQIQYHNPDGRGKFLPPATYSFTTQIRERGVYSFCMCPGGFIVPSMTNASEIVVNGMSPANRNSPFANSGFVVEIRLEDMPNYQEHGALAGLFYQKKLEKSCFQIGKKSIIAPAQRLTDFVKGHISNDLPDCSYLPGVVSAPVHKILPVDIYKRLKGAFLLFGKWAKGFLTEDAVVVGVETRTSSPVRIPRNNDTFQHIQIEGLFPCGEGAGYAGGIVSSAIDGEISAQKVSDFLKK